MRIYLAGPMRGYDLFNFPAFDRGAAQLRGRGYTVCSPAEMDRDVGFDKHSDLDLPPRFMAEAFRRDLDALLGVDAIVLLPGWEASTGAQLELTVARALELPAFTIDEGGYLDPLRRPATEETVLEEAQRLVHGDRGDDYGHPADDFARAGRIWGAILGIPDVPPATVGLCMIGVKLSREVHRPKRDNRTDIAGYAETVDMCHTRPT